jgi:ABC-type nitrate/sulfonate/bicarbonate transport system substrate-binding protein
MTTPPSAIPRVTEQYHLRVAEFFPIARWTIGPQILVKKGSPYKTLASLKGKKVAITPLNTRFGAEEAAIEAATGQNIRSYFKLEQTNAAAQELTLGRVDAAFIEAPTTYPLLQSGKFKAIYSVHDAFLKAFGDPAVVNGGYIARTGFIKGASGFVRDLVKATQAVWNQYVKDPASVNDVASKQSGIPAAQLAVVGQVLDLQKMPVKLRAITPQDVRSWSKIFPLLQKSGFIKKAPKNVASLFVITK